MQARLGSNLVRFAGRAMSIVSSSENDYRTKTGSTNVSELIQLSILSNEKSKVQINMDDCHYWYQANTVTEPNVNECIRDFAFSILRFFHDDIIMLAITLDGSFFPDQENKSIQLLTTSI